jgi:hypothetical protein
MNPGKIGQIGRGLAEITAMEGIHGGKPMEGNPWRETMEGDQGRKIQTFFFNVCIFLF